MTDTDQPELVQVARDLRELTHLHHDLRAQAVAKADDHTIPGGDAMVMLAPVANPEAWEHQYEAREQLERPTDHIQDEDDSWETPLQTLLFWSEQWRARHGATSDMRPTVESEARFLAGLLTWAIEHEPAWDQFTKSIRQARRRIENVVHAGHRDIFSDSVDCLLCGTRLRRRVSGDYYAWRGAILQGTDTALATVGYEDDWWCQGCRRHLTSPELDLARAEAARKGLGI